MSDTPAAIARSLAWECFRDASYYDMWCVRQTDCRTWGQGFHLISGDEARSLCDLLNGLAVRAELEKNDAPLP